MCRVYLIGDTHFQDTDILRYENRPFETIWEEEETLIENWNKTVNQDDMVWHLGDFSIQLPKEDVKRILNELNGKKFLIMGNHDNFLTDKEWEECGFIKAYDRPIIYDDFYLLSHKPMYMTRNMPYVNIFAHVHNNPMYNTVSEVGRCVSAERTYYTPILFKQIKKELHRERTKNHL